MTLLDRVREFFMWHEHKRSVPIRARVRLDDEKIRAEQRRADILRRLGQIEIDYQAMAREPVNRD